MVFNGAIFHGVFFFNDCYKVNSIDKWEIILAIVMWTTMGCVILNKDRNYLDLWRSSSLTSNTIGCLGGLFVVPELDPLVDTDGEADSEMFSPSDRAMALISSSCSLLLSVGLDFKLEPGASELEGAVCAKPPGWCH